MDIYFDHTAPSIVVEIPEYRNGYVDIRKRGGRIRAFTEITNDNIHYCKELMKLVDELRHLNGVKGGIAVSESEYMATTLLEEAKPLTQVIFSSVKEVVEQGQYIFDTLWNTAIPAEQRIREIEEGVVPVRTRLVDSQDEIIHEISRLNNSADRLSICSTYGGMQMSYKYFFDSYRRIAGRRHGRADDDDDIGDGGCNDDGLRWIINIDKDSLDLVKVFLESGIQVRHIKNMPPMNFGVSDKEVALTIERMEGGSVSQSFLISNEPLYVNHFNSLFEELWKNSIDAKGRITAIEQGLEPEFLEVITDNEKASQILVDLAKSVRKEALFFLPNDRALLRMERLGVIDYLIHASQNGVEVKIICCLTADNSESVKRMSINAPNIRILNGDISPYGMLIVDGEKFLRAELREPTAIEFSEAIGFTIYSNSKRSVESFKMVFELLWNERKLNEELKRAYKMQKEFIDIAAHELRNPIQPILSLTEILRNKIKDTEQLELLNATIRSAKRLHRLSEDILDVTRIESQSLNLKKEPFSLSEMILNAIADSKNQLKKDNNIIMKLTCMEDFFVEADKARLNQVIVNLLSNAVKFTPEGIISIVVEKNKREEEHGKQIVVSIKDTGAGIDPEIFPKLFGKFVTKSEAGGIGLGLFISKSIVEAHGGKIWAENNPDGKGATFSVSLPLST